MLPTRTLRYAVNRRSTDPLNDEYQGLVPRIFRGETVSIKVALFDGDEEEANLITDVSNIAQITVSALVNTPSGKSSNLPVLYKEIEVADIDQSLTWSEWEAGTGQHFAAEFTAAQTDVRIGDTGSEYWLVIGALLDSGERVTLGAGLMRVDEDGIQSATPPDPPSGETWLTESEINALFASKDSIRNSFPQGETGVLAAAHGSTVYEIVRYVSKSGDDANSGITPYDPKLTIKSAIESLDGLSGSKRVGTIHVGPGQFIEEPMGVTSTALGQGFRIFGSGTNPVSGTEIVMHSGAASTDDLLTFHATENVHHTLIDGVIIDMRGYGRDAIRIGRGGFNTALRDLSFKNVPRWCCYHFARPVTLQVDNVTGGYCGFGQGMSTETVTFADAGGGAFYMSQPALPQWAVGQTVRLSTSGALPPEYAQNKNYYIVDDGGLKRLAATLGGAPIVATTAGTGTHRLYGGDAIPDIGQVTFADIGGGAYHLVNPLPRDWVAGDLVRVRATGLIPTNLAGGTDYELMDDAGVLKLSVPGSGVPLPAATAGTGTIWLEDTYDPELEGGFFFLNNATSSSLSSVSFDAIQLDACGRYPFFVDEQASSPTTASVISIRGIETEVPFFSSAFCHDALVGVRGSPNDAKTALVIESAQCHTAGGGINMMKALVKQLDAGPLTIVLSAQNLFGAGSQYDFLLAVADQTLLVDFELAPLFAAGGPIIHHGDTADGIAFKASHGARSAGGHPHPMIQIRDDGRFQWGTGASAPTTRISISASGNLIIENSPTSDPGEAGALWLNGTSLELSAG